MKPPERVQCVGELKQGVFRSRSGAIFGWAELVTLHPRWARNAEEAYFFRGPRRNSVYVCIRGGAPILYPDLDTAIAAALMRGANNG